MAGQKIKELVVSTGGSSSYYDIVFNKEQLHMIKSTNRVYFDDFIDIAFGGDKLYKEFIKHLYFAHTDEVTATQQDTEIPKLLVLHKTQVDKALADGKLSLDDFFLVLFKNDFDCCTILKSLKRAYEDINGRGKFGSGTEYNLNKIEYSLDKLNDRVNITQGIETDNVWFVVSLLDDIKSTIK